MKDFKVRIKKPDGSSISYTTIEFTSARAYEAAAARYGYLCAVSVVRA